MIDGRDAIQRFLEETNYSDSLRFQSSLGTDSANVAIISCLVFLQFLILLTLISTWSITVNGGLGNFLTAVYSYYWGHLRQLYWVTVSLQLVRCKSPMLPICSHWGDEISSFKAIWYGYSDEKYTETKVKSSQDKCL